MKGRGEGEGFGCRGLGGASWIATISMVPWGGIRWA